MFDSALEARILNHYENTMFEKLTQIGEILEKLKYILRSLDLLLQIIFIEFSNLIIDVSHFARHYQVI